MEQRISILCQISLLLSERIYDDDIRTLEDYENLLKQLVSVSTLISYAEILDKMENQDFFEILPDFYRMPLSQELSQYFEFGTDTNMRLLKNLQSISLEIYNQFRQAQYEHLRLIGKQDYFHLDELNIEHPPQQQWYPIQIQMFARLKNQAVDRVQMDKNGFFRLAKRHTKLVLPGGGMLEPNLEPSKQVKLEKMLEEHVEEQQSNFYVTGKLFIDAIPSQDFLEQCLMELTSQAYEYLNQLHLDEQCSVMMELKAKVMLPALNSLRLKAMVDILDNCLLDSSNHMFRRVILQLRARLQWVCFKMSSLYSESLQLVQHHSVMMQIPMFLDCRVLGGFQFSNTFLQRGELLEDWFKQKLGNKSGLLGDDLAGSSYVHYHIWQAFQHYRQIPHLLNLVVYQILMLNGPDGAQYLEKWHKKQYLSAIQVILQAYNELIDELMDRFRNQGEYIQGIGS